MILEEPIFVEYKDIMKIMYTMYIIPSKSYCSTDIKNKIERKIRDLASIR